MHPCVQLNAVPHLPAVAALASFWPSTPSCRVMQRGSAVQRWCVLMRCLYSSAVHLQVDINTTALISIGSSGVMRQVCRVLRCASSSDRCWRLRLYVAGRTGAACLPRRSLLHAATSMANWYVVGMVYITWLTAAIFVWKVSDSIAAQFADEMAACQNCQWLSANSMSRPYRRTPGHSS